MGKESEQTAQQLLSFYFHTLSPFLINMAHVVRLCLIMHDCYQEQNPLNEALLNGNTTIPPEAKGGKKDNIVFFEDNKCSLESIGATKYMKVNVLYAMFMLGMKWAKVEHSFRDSL